jgi:hypothetical protein
VHQASGHKFDSLEYYVSIDTEAPVTVFNVFRKAPWEEKLVGPPGLEYLTYRQLFWSFIPSVSKKAPKKAPTVLIFPRARSCIASSASRITR